MRDYLVFQLYGPLLSWGDIAVGETRPSALTPSKSAVLGLVAAALGIKRPDTVADETERMACEKRHAELAQGYGLGIFVQVLGSPLSDYHTAQVPSSGAGRNRKVFPTRRDELTWLPRAELNTILSRREYRQDAYAACALWRRESAVDAPSLEVSATSFWNLAFRSTWAVKPARLPCLCIPSCVLPKLSKPPWRRSIGRKHLRTCWVIQRRNASAKNSVRMEAA